ncbi:2Fe-2S iron-sulfur cluster-binding protein [Calditerricola satsumensis]|uniref:Ferredoxin n=1 Tax=Calditerricola satsumensis TaxID=373054 RepID=A0A8J3B2G2_9BACI|nr:2Fe-2S iron-sulfur cluster-binding protein [Calditerricola satsumensis]GGJ90619.1 ferredoxin [Calditerricola satsumensis]
MPKIRFLTSGVTVEVPEGKEAHLLVTSIRHHDEDGGIPYRCSAGLCGTCRTKIEEGAEHLSPIRKAEVERLGEELLKQGYRLACQTFVRGGDVAVSWNEAVKGKVSAKVKAHWEAQARNA